MAVNNKKTFQYRKKSSGAGTDPNNVNPRKKDTNDNQKRHTENLDREIMKGCESGNKPNVGKINKYVNLMSDFASDILKEYKINVRPPLSVVAEVIKNSQDIEVCRKEMKQLTVCEEYSEYISRVSSMIHDLQQLNDELVSKYYQLMFDMFPNIDDMDSAIRKADDSADVRKIKYQKDATIEVNSSADVHKIKYKMDATIEVNSSADVRKIKYKTDATIEVKSTDYILEIMKLHTIDGGRI